MAGCQVFVGSTQVSGLIVLVYLILTQRDVRKTYEKHHLECHWSAIFIHGCHGSGMPWEITGRKKLGMAPCLSSARSPKQVGGAFHRIPLVVTGIWKITTHF